MTQAVLPAVRAAVITRRRTELPSEYVQGPATLTRPQLAERHGTAPADAARIRDVLSAYGLEVTGTDASSRRLRVAGTVAAMAAAFGASLSRVSSPGSGGGRTVHR